MRGIALGFVLATAAVAAADKPREPKLEPHTSEAGRYRVQMPDDPKTETKELATAAGVIRMTTDRAEAGRDLVLAVTVAVYPDGFKDLAAKTVLDGVRDGLKGVDGRVTADADATVEADGGTVKGREFRVEAGRNAIRCRAFLVGNRLYQVTATGPKDGVGGPTADRFLKSFEVLKP